MWFLRVACCAEWFCFVLCVARVSYSAPFSIDRVKARGADSVAFLQPPVANPIRLRTVVGCINFFDCNCGVYPNCFFLDILLWQMALCVCAFCFAGVSALEQPCSHCLTSVVVSLQPICIHSACVAQVTIAKVVRNASRRRFCWGRGNCRNKLSVLALHHGKAAVSW